MCIERGEAHWAGESVRCGQVERVDCAQRVASTQLGGALQAELIDWHSSDPTPVVEQRLAELGGLSWFGETVDEHERFGESQ